MSGNPVIAGARAGPPPAGFARTLGRVLRRGVAFAATLVAVGGAISLARRGHALTDYGAFTGEPEDLRSVPGILNGAWTLRGRGLIQLGLLVLMATPVARVAFSVVGFSRERDWFYAGAAAVVLALLLVSLAGS